MPWVVVWLCGDEVKKIVTGRYGPAWPVGRCGQAVAVGLTALAGHTKRQLKTLSLAVIDPNSNQSTKVASRDAQGRRSGRSDLGPPGPAGMAGVTGVVGARQQGVSFVAEKAWTRGGQY